MILILSLMLPLQARVGQPSCGTECSLMNSLQPASCDWSQTDKCTHAVIFISLHSLEFPYSMKSSRRKHLLCLYFKVMAFSADLETQTWQQRTFVGEAEEGSKLRAKWLRAAEVFKQNENTEIFRKQKPVRELKSFLLLLLFNKALMCCFKEVNVRNKCEILQPTIFLEESKWCRDTGLDRHLRFLVSPCPTFHKSSCLSNHPMGEKAIVLEHNW